MNQFINDLKSAAMCGLLKHTKHKRFFTQEEYEADQTVINEIYRTANNLDNHIKSITINK